MRIFKSKWFQRFARKEGIEDAALREAVHRADINEDEEEQFKEAAKHVLSLTEDQLSELLKRGDFVEVKANEQEVSK